ncbi:unnamed protein product [Mytilus edulis]|uniref:Uncharacterized protein n=1 Tax=Mytilus edulis TaxID=6550 RepID=A0A8S3UU69_MYTED|nr:unnamed protein product [Mytilus edulis]
MKDGMKNGYSKIDLRCTNLSSLIMGDVESDEHLRIFKCLIDTGSLVLRNVIGIKLLNNYSISFVQYLENNKHQFYHQFEKEYRENAVLVAHMAVFSTEPWISTFSIKCTLSGQHRIRGIVWIDLKSMPNFKHYKTCCGYTVYISHYQFKETPLKIVDIEKLIKDGICGFDNCVKSENNKTKSYINDTFQDFKENIEKHHEVLSTRCREEIKSTVTQESSNTRLHSEDQRRAIDTKLTESEQRVCQTVIQSQGRLEDKLIKEQNKTRNHTVELKADLIEENRILKDEVIDVKTELKELKTILIGYIGKQKVDLVMITDQIEKSTESPDTRKVDFTAKVNQTRMTANEENEIIEKLPPEVEIQTNNEGLPDAAVTETIEITGEKSQQHHFRIESYSWNFT